MRYLGVKLQAEERPFPMTHRCVRAVARLSQNLKAVVELFNAIAVAHPHGSRAFVDAVKERFARADLECGLAVFAFLGGSDLRSQRLATELESVANAEDR